MGAGGMGCAGGGGTGDGGSGTAGGGGTGDGGSGSGFACAVSTEAAVTCSPAEEFGSRNTVRIPAMVYARRLIRSSIIQALEPGRTTPSWQFWRDWAPREPEPLR